MEYLIWRNILSLISLSKYKNIFFDRDGIINHVVMRDFVVGSPRYFEEFIIRSDFRALYSRIPREVNLFVITNQPDLSRNLMELVELTAMHDVLRSDFRFKSIEYCPHDDIDCCFCRKPKPGMIDRLVHKLELDKRQSVVIGDSVKDIDCAFNAGVDAIFLSTQYNQGTVSKQVPAVTELNELTF